MAEGFTAYLETAGAQIRWKRARPALLRELQTHLLEQEADCLANGMDPEAAEAEAIRQMGDPVLVGLELDKVHRPRPQWGPLVWTLLLALACGFLRVWLTAGWHDTVSPQRTALALVLGMAALTAAYLSDCTLLYRHPRLIWLGGILLSLLSLLLSPRFAGGVSYFTRYLVLTYPLLYALWVSSWQGRGRKGLLLAILGGVPLVLLGMLTPYTPGVLLFLLTGFALLLAAARMDWFGIGRLRTALPVLWTALAGLAALCLHPGLAVRLSRALHPELDPGGWGYQGTTVRSSLAASQWLGRGNLENAFGMSYERIIPEGARDFLPTTLIHRLGWLPWLMLLAGLAYLLVWLLVRCGKQQNRLGRLLALAAVLPLLLRVLSSAVLNLGFVLFSASCPLLVGNLQTVLDLACIGLALAVFRQDALPWTAPHRPPYEVQK